MNDPKPQTAGQVAASVHRFVRPVITHENMEWCRRRQWSRNKQRLRTLCLNALTLGLGENLWYGDRLDRKVDVVPSIGRLRNPDIDSNNTVSAGSGTNEVSNPRDEIQGRKLVKRWILLGYQVTIECLHKASQCESNAEVSHSRPTVSVDDTQNL